MQFPDGPVEESGLAIQLRRLPREHPAAGLSVEHAADNANKASVTVPGGPASAGHRENAIHAPKVPMILDF